MALDKLTKIDGGGISTTSNYRVGIITASKFIGPFDGSVGNFSGIITALGANFSGNVTIGGTLTYEDVTNIDSVGIITAQQGIHVGAGVSAVGVGTFGSLDIGGDIDVDGHTNLDNVSIAGVTTSSGNITISNTLPTLLLTDTNHDADWSVRNSNGNFTIYDETSSVGRFTINGAGTANVPMHLSVGNSLSVTGNITASGKVTATEIDLNGDLDVDGHTNLDNVSIAGVSTFSNDVNFTTANGNNLLLDNSDNSLKFGDNVKAIFGTGTGDLEIYHSGTGSIINDIGVGHLHLRVGGSNRINIQPDNVALCYSGNAKLETTSTGITVTGTVVSTGADINGDLDVDGHTNLDNVSIAGVSTFSNNVHLLDNDELRVGGSAGTFDGMKLHHDGTNSIINDTGTGALILDGSKIRLRLSGSTQLETDTNGIIATGTAHRFQSGTSGDCELIIEADTDNNNELDNPRILFRQDGGNDWSAIGTNDNVLEISNSVGSGGILFKTGSTNGYTNATGRWKIDTNGHLLPNTAGAVNIGSASAEIGDVYIADSKKAYFGSDQDFQISHNGSHAIVKETTGRLYVLGDDIWFKNQADNESLARFMNGGEVFLYNNDTLRLTTTTTGITVGGEVAATQDYPNFRPTLDFNFAAEKKLDPRITYQRTGSASFTDEFGKVVLVGDNVPRFDHDPVTRESKGLLIEHGRTNLVEDNTNYSGWIDYSSTHAKTTDVKAPDGSYNAWKVTSTGAQNQFGIYDAISYTANTIYTHSLWLKAGNVTRVGLSVSSGTRWTTAPYLVVDLDTGTVNATGSSLSTKLTAYPNGWYLLEATGQFGSTTQSDGFWSYTAQTGGFSGNTTAYFYQWGGQVEEGAYATSFIPSNGANTTRGADITTIDGDEFTEFYNDDEWTLVTHTNVDNSKSLVASPSEVNSINFEGDNNTKKFMTRYVTDSTENQGYVDVIGNMSGTSYFDLVGGGTGNYNMKTAFAAKVNDVAASFNGGTVQTDTSVTMLEGGSIMNIGQNPKQCHIKRIMYYPKRLPNSQLVTLTS